MNITDLKAGSDWQLIVTADDGRVGSFDVSPYLDGSVFQPLDAKGGKIVCREIPVRQQFVAVNLNPGNDKFMLGGW